MWSLTDSILNYRTFSKKGHSRSPTLKLLSTTVSDISFGSNFLSHDMTTLLCWNDEFEKSILNLVTAIPNLHVCAHMRFIFWIMYWTVFNGLFERFPQYEPKQVVNFINFMFRFNSEICLCLHLITKTNLSQNWPNFTTHFAAVIPALSTDNGPTATLTPSSFLKDFATGIVIH